MVTEDMGLTANNGSVLQLNNATTPNTELGELDHMTIAAYFAIAIATFGIFGNITIIKFMASKPFSGMAHSILCVALAIVDLSYNIVVLTQFAVFLVFGISIDLVNRGICKFLSFSSFYIGHLDSWLVTALTLERLIAVTRPLQIATIVTKFQIKLGIFCLLVVYLLFDGELLFRADLTTVSYEEMTFKLCEGAHDFGLPERLWVIKDIMMETLITFVPMAIIIPSNIVILVKLYQQKKVRERLGAQNSNQPGTGKTTAMIICMTTAFVLLLAPYSIYYFLFGNHGNDPVATATFIIGSTNPSINFVLYFVSGQQFRQEVLSWIKSKCSCFCPTEQTASVSTGVQSRATSSINMSISTISNSPGNINKA